MRIEIPHDDAEIEYRLSDVADSVVKNCLHRAYHVFELRTDHTYQEVLTQAHRRKLRELRWLGDTATPTLGPSNIELEELITRAMREDWCLIDIRNAAGHIGYGYWNDLESAHVARGIEQRQED